MSVKEREEKWNNKYRKIVIQNSFTKRLQKTLLNEKNQLINQPIKIGSQFIFGTTSKGKTTYAAFLLLQAHKNWYLKNNSLFPMQSKKYIMVTYQDIIKEARQSIKEKDVTEYDVIEKYEEADILVIDDFGIAKTTDFTYNIFLHLLTYREENLLTTIITSNFDIKELANKSDDSRIPARIIRTCDNIQFEFTGFKGKRIKDKQS